MVGQQNKKREKGREENSNMIKRKGAMRKVVMRTIRKTIWSTRRRVVLELVTSPSVRS